MVVDKCCCRACGRATVSELRLCAQEFALWGTAWWHTSGFPVGERRMQPCRVEAPKHARRRCFCLSPCENGAPCHASLCTIMAARAASARHAMLQRDVPRRVACQCRACGTRCDVRVVPACSAVCMRNSVSVSLGICRTAASLSLSLSLSCLLLVRVRVCLCLSVA